MPKLIPQGDWWLIQFGEEVRTDLPIAIPFSRPPFAGLQDHYAVGQSFGLLPLNPNVDPAGISPDLSGNGNDGVSSNVSTYALQSTGRALMSRVRRST